MQKAKPETEQNGPDDADLRDTVADMEDSQCRKLALTLLCQALDDVAPLPPPVEGRTEREYLHEYAKWQALVAKKVALDAHFHEQHKQEILACLTRREERRAQGRPLGQAYVDREESLLTRYAYGDKSGLQGELITCALDWFLCDRERVLFWIQIASVSPVSVYRQLQGRLTLLGRTDGRVNTVLVRLEDGEYLDEIEVED